MLEIILASDFFYLKGFLFQTCYYFFLVTIYLLENNFFLKSNFLEN